MSINTFGNRLRSMALPIVFCAVVLGCICAPQACADSWDKATVVTFSDAVQIPGQILPAGTYVFRLLDSQSSRNVVQVWDKDRRHLYATILAIPTYRENPPSKALVSLDESGTDEPAVHEWYYPGDQWGQEFVYRNRPAMQMAKNTPPPAPEPVAQEETPAAIAPVTPAEPAPTAEPSDDAKTDETAAPSPFVEPEAQDTAQPQDSAPAPATQDQQDQPKEMPKTGSELPLIGLAGLCTLGTGVAIRFRRRRITQ